MNIAIGSDHAGFNLKKAMISLITEMGYQHEDFGCYDTSSVDYPDVAHTVANAVIERKFNLGILSNNGWGVPWNPFEAFRLFRACAEQGMPEAEYLVGLYYTDNLVIPRDDEKALYWVRKSVEAGYANLLAEPVVKKGIGATQMSILVDSGHHPHHHRHLPNIEKIIDSGELDQSVKENSIHIFRRLAAAEAKVHRTAIESVHFHEVGAVDAILDVVGSAIGLHHLGIERVYCSPIHVGSGTVECAHGTFPVPARHGGVGEKHTRIFNGGEG